VVRLKANRPGWGQVAVKGFPQLGGRPNENVSVPNGGHAELGIGTHLDPYIADLVLDGRQAWPLGQAEERPFHEVALVPDWNVYKTRGKEVLLLTSRKVAAANHVKAIGRARSKPQLIVESYLRRVVFTMAPFQE
jgi:hypothetical protein